MTSGQIGACGRRRRRAPAATLVAGLLLVLLVAGGRPPAAAAPADWTSYLDGTVYHSSLGSGETPDLVKHDPFARQGDDFLWAGSSGGLTGFQIGDSTTVRLTRNDGLPAQDVTAVAVDAAGHLWVGSRAAGLSARDSTGTWLRRPLDRFDLGSDSMRVLLELDEQLWVGTAAGAARLRYPDDPDLPGDGSVLELVNIASFLGQSPYVNAIAARDDTTWFGTRRGVVRLEPDGERALQNDGLGAAIDIQALAWHGGALWAATTGGVFRLEGGVWTARATGIDPAFEPRSLAVFGGTLYLGVRAGDSVYRLDDATGGWSPLKIESGRIVAGLLGQGGRLWAATNRGLYVLGTDDTWRRLPSVDPPAAVFIATDFDYLDVAGLAGGGWAVTRSFVTRLGEDGAWQAVRRGDGGLEGTALSRLALDGAAGQLLLGHCCCGTGATCRAELLDAALGEIAAPIPAYDLLAIAPAPDGRFWLGSIKTDTSEGEGLYRYDPVSGELVHYTPSGGEGAEPLPGMSSTTIAALAFDARGRLWIGHQFEGVDIWSEPGNTSASVRHLGQFDGLPSDRITAIAAAGDGAWVGTASGVGAVSGDLLVTRALGSDQLPDAQVNDIALDGCGRVWVATQAGVVRLDAEGSLEAVFDDTSALGPADERVSAISVDLQRAGVWFATQLGLSRFEYDPSCRGSAAGGGAGGACTRLCPYPNPLRLDRGQHEVFLTDAPAGAAVTVLDALGRLVARVGGGASDAAVWDGRDAGGAPVPSGVYLLTIRDGGTTLVRPLAVIR